MLIKLEVKYSDQEYQHAVTEKLAAMPYRYLHSYGPICLFVAVSIVLYWFDVIGKLASIITLLLLGGYSLFCLLGDILTAKIALFFAKRGKLLDTYHFEITKQGIKRTSEKGEMNWLWPELMSVEVFENTIFFNQENGSMVLPKSRLSEEELTELLEKIDQNNRE
mgnify:FL=1